MGLGAVGNLQGPQNHSREIAHWSQLATISTHQALHITQPPGAMHSACGPQKPSGGSSLTPSGPLNGTRHQGLGQPALNHQQLGLPALKLTEGGALPLPGPQDRPTLHKMGQMEQVGGSSL